MKKYLLLLVVSIGFASISFGQTSYGIKAGLNFPKLTASGGGVSVNTKASTNFYFTGYVDAGIGTNWSIQPGLSLQGKGGKVNAFFDGNLVDNDGTLSLLYIEVPVNFVHYIPAGSGKVFLGAGPSLGFGVTSKIKGNHRSESVSFDDLGLNTFDLGLNFLAGYKLTQGFLINAGYSLGLTNMLKDSDGETLKNRVFSVGIGYQF